MLKQTKLGISKVWTNTLALLIVLLVISTTSVALPSNPTVESITNSTADLNPVLELVTEGGSFTTMLINGSSQNYRWKAYLGNVTGYLTLADATNYSIYDWEFAIPQGEVYASRSNDISWGTISCANETIIASEETALNFQNRVDSINNTFNNKIHKEFIVGTQTIAESTCPAIATNINGEIQTQTADAKFQEILLQDGNNLIYSTILESGEQGFDTSNYDFQMIVADDETIGVQTPYYFYVELG